MEIQRSQQLDVAQRALHHALGRGPIIFFQQVLFKGPRIDADADRDPAVPGAVHHGLDLFRAADVAGVDPQTVGAGPGGRDGQTVVEVDVGDHRDPHLLLDAGNRRGRLGVRHRHPHDVASGRLQAPDLGHGGGDVLGAACWSWTGPRSGAPPPTGTDPTMICRVDLR